MNELKSVIDSLYTQFILRDIFSKVVPGIIALTSLMLLLRPRKSPFEIWSEIGESMSKVSAWAWIIVLGIAWVGGFAVQGFGEKTSLIRHYPAEMSEHDYNDVMLKFLDKATEGEKTRLERFQVIREACGNSYLALTAALGLLLVNMCLYLSREDRSPISLDRFVRYGVAMCFAVLLTYSLYSYHLHHVNRQVQFVQDVLEHHEVPSQPVMTVPPISH